MPNPPDDEFTELIDASIGRVDLVDKAANGLSFLMAKSADDSPAGLMAPDLVRDLIGKTADPQPTRDVDNVKVVVTVSGGGPWGPEDVARLINRDAARQPTHLTKEADMAETDDLDPTVVLAEPAEDAPGNVNAPGSPAWEAVDAATARKWTAILSRAKTALLVMEDRELIEAAAGDIGDFDSALDLNNAACAIDYAISVLAPFAVDEQAEVDAADLEAVGKALTDCDPAALDVIETLTPVAKAGRSLSASNERAIREAVESLQKVLASLPAAPDTQEGGRQVAKKETDMTGTAPETVETPNVEPVGKADGEGDGKAPMVAVYDAKGKLVGIVDPMEITPISGADAGEETPEAPAEAAEPTADLEPAPADEVGVPADEGVAKEADPVEDTEDVAKTAPTTDPDDVLKSTITDLVKGMLDAHSADHTAQLTKTGEAIVELAEVVETLKGQVRSLEVQPAQPGVFASGALPPAHQLRGQDNGAAPVDMTQARELKKAMYGGTATEQNKAAVQMQTAAIDALKAIHRGA